MLARLWRPSHPTRYGWQERLGAWGFLTLAKPRVRRSNGKAAKYLCIVPPRHDGLFHARSGKTYRWVPILKNGYSSVIAALLAAQGCQGRYMNYAQKPAERLAKHHIPRQQLCIWGRREWVQYPRPLAFEFMREAPFAPDPKADIRFCVVRDPVERFVSGYRGQMLVPPVLRKTAPELSLTYSKPLSMDAFIERLCEDWADAPWQKNRPRRENGFAHDDHFWPQHHFAGEDAGYYTHIFNMSALPKLAELLSDLSGRRVGMPRLNTSDMSVKPNLSAQSRQQIERLYAQDYRVFGKYF